MSKIQKCADKFFQCFYVGPKIVGTIVGYCRKGGEGEVGVHIPAIMVY
jgi:hypothetical protein